MNAEDLLAHYERIADAPDAVAHLRRFILDLAVRGKLVPQDPNDEPATSALERIATAKATLDRKERLRKRQRDRADARSSATDLPSGWALAPLSELMAVLNGRAYSKDELLDAGTPVLRVGNLFTSDKWYYSNLQLEADKYCDTGDLIFAWSASFGPFIWSGGRVIYHYHIWKLELYSQEELDKEFIYNFLLQKTREIKEAGHGVSMIHMTKEKMEQIEVPLPPLAEQCRIVAKVDELMALCDRLEAARTAREASRDRFTAATLARLDAPDPDIFRDDARFALDALLALTTRPDQIKRLRQTILNLAVRGKLVPQDPKDEPASKILDEISQRRKLLYADRRIPRPKPVPSINELERPFVIPSKWTWSRLGDLCYQVSDGPHYSPQYVGSDEGVPFLSTRNVRIGSFDLSTLKYVSRSDHEEFCKRIRPEPGDILYTKGGTTGIAKVNDLDFDFSVWVHLAVLRIEKQLLFPHYLELALNSPHCYAQSQNYTQGISNFDLGLTRMIKITVPIPPLAEQHRIVAKVDELMTLCDRLEASLTTAADTRRRLLDALLAEALAPADVHELEAAQ